VCGLVETGHFVRSPAHACRHEKAKYINTHIRWSTSFILRKCRYFIVVHPKITSSKRPTGQCAIRPHGGSPDAPPLTALPTDRAFRPAPPHPHRWLTLAQVKAHHNTLLFDMNMKRKTKLIVKNKGWLTHNSPKYLERNFSLREIEIFSFKRLKELKYAIFKLWKMPK